jgi:hypothetical protein
MSKEDLRPLGPSPVTAFIRRAIKHALWQVHYHERALIDAHEELAMAKAFMLREGVTEFSLEELRAEIEKEEEGDDE